jgi:hypothetical protein
VDVAVVERRASQDLPTVSELLSMDEPRERFAAHEP